MESLLRKKCKTTKPLLREFLAEFLGTFILVVIGDGSIAQYIVFGDKGLFISVNWAWGIAVMMGVWVSGGVSGGHLNPAVSLVMSVFGRLPWKSLPVYMLAQYLGAFVASTAIFGVYHDAVNHIDPDRTRVGAGIWATYKSDYLSNANGFADQVLGTALLLICALAVTDKDNIGLPRGMEPLGVGFALAGIGMSYGVNCGYAINPARDLAPRLFTLMAGWGSDTVVGEESHNWFWVPVVAPHIGGLIGGFMYILMVGIHTDQESAYVEEVVEVKSKPSDKAAKGLGDNLSMRRQPSTVSRTSQKSKS